MAKPQDLAGGELALWVARALSWPTYTQQRGPTAGEKRALPLYAEDAIYFVDAEKAMRADFKVDDHFRPHEKWSQGGAIIEREKIGLDRPSGGQKVPQWRAIVDNRSNRGDWALRSPIVAWAEQPLVAAMRCYVASVFGDTLPGVLP